MLMGSGLNNIGSSAVNPLRFFIHQIVGGVDEIEVAGSKTDHVFVLSPQERPVFFVLREIGVEMVLGSALSLN
jgi:hypothetical protein